MTDKITHAAIGIIIQEGRCLIARRPEGGHVGGYWEFPGGTILPGETPEDCLHREVFEETGLKIDIDRTLTPVEHLYPDRRVHLTFYICRTIENTAYPVENSTVKWVLLKELDRYRFPEANQSILKLLQDYPWGES